MEFLFAGICLFVDDPRPTNDKNGKNGGTRGKVAIFPNGKNHTPHLPGENGKSGGPAPADHFHVPDHSTFLLADPDEVDYRRWGPPLRVRLGSKVKLIFPIEDEKIRFEPAPDGELADLNDLPSVNELCNGTFNSDTVTFRDEAIAALVKIPGGPVTTHINDTSARIVRLELQPKTVIIASSFHSKEERELRLTKDSASVVMANVVLPDAFTGQSDEVIHSSLFCTLLDHGQRDLRDPGVIDQLTLTGTCSPRRG